MPFWNWNLFRKPTMDASGCNAYADTLGLVAHARAELSPPSIRSNAVNAHGDQILSEATPLKPRTNVLVGKLLAGLWQDDPIILLLVHDALTRRPQYDPIMRGMAGNTALDRELLQIASMPGVAAAALPASYFMRELQAFTRRQTPCCPEDCEVRYDAVVAGLRACLRHNMQELHQTDEIVPLDYVFDCLKIGSKLAADDYLREVFCEMLITIRQIIALERDGPLISRLETLRRELHTFLFRASHTHPILWQMLKDPATSEVFWPVVDMMRSHWCSPFVPPLLDALPFLSDDGKARVIAALHDIGDPSALPALQQLAQEKTSRVSPLAAKAVKSILRHNKGDAAQLLRAADAQGNANAGATLLRPVEANANLTRPEELLRPEN